jgi:hypothetical protein
MKPADTRYVPFVQQLYCCVPTCVQIVLYKNKLALIPQEEIGTQLGLVVPEEVKDLFYGVETAKQPPIGSGFGTRIQIPKFSMSQLIKKQKWPFTFDTLLASVFKDVHEFVAKLHELVQNDNDVLVCFQNDHDAGHVCVIDKVSTDEVRLIDPSQNFPKWRNISSQELFDRVQVHGDTNYGGIWVFTKL